jgi:hypothetical protein
MKVPTYSEIQPLFGDVKPSKNVTGENAKFASIKCKYEWRTPKRTSVRSVTKSSENGNLILHPGPVGLVMTQHV